MVETQRIKYLRLFDIHVLHHYWLDDGGTVFDTLSPEAQSRVLLTYDVRALLSITPDPSTAAVLRGLGGMIRLTTLGLTVAVPEDAVVPAEEEFVFFVVSVDPRYAGYTALTLRSQRILDVADPSGAKLVRRFKENVPLLSNLTGAARGTGSETRLFLSREYPGGDGDGVEALVLSGSTIRQLLGDPPDAPFQSLGPADTHPVYLHQGDVPQIAPPAGAAGTPTGAIQMTSDTPAAVLAVIKVVARRADDHAFSFTTAEGRAREPARVFEVHLRNRWTTRRYLDQRNGLVISTDSSPLPLTHHGNAGTKQKPSPTAIGVERGATDPRKITALVSDIYI